LTDKKEPTKEELDNNSSADDIAKVMAANMAANMNDPNFLADKALMEDKVRREIIQKRKEREKNQQNEK
jgi:hypothetical protein